MTSHTINTFQHLFLMTFLLYYKLFFVLCSKIQILKQNQYAYACTCVCMHA